MKILYNPRPLLVFILEKWERKYKETTLEAYKLAREKHLDQVKKNGGSRLMEITMIDGSIVSSSQIVRVEPASALEEFEIFVYPTLSTTARSDYLRLASSARVSGAKPSIIGIISAMERIQAERSAELTSRRVLTDSELTRRAIQVETERSRVRSMLSAV